jgi:hypothetical protein
VGCSKRELGRANKLLNGQLQPLAGYVPTSCRQGGDWLGDISQRLQNEMEITEANMRDPVARSVLR